MDKRRCGYCRQYGHNASKCETKAGVIKTAAIHVGNQRRELADLLIRNGWGVGALVNAFAYEIGGEVPCLMTQESLDSVMRNNFIEFHNVRYSKRVSTRIFDYVGLIVPAEEEHTHTLQRPAINMKLMPMQTGIRDVYGTIHISCLTDGLKWKGYPAPTNYSWDYPSKLLVPSHEGRVSEEALRKPFHCHDRLGRATIDPIFT